MLQEKINKDYITAMKGKDALKSGSLSFLRAQLKNLMIERKTDALTDEDVIGIIKKQVKQRQDSIEQYEKGNRPDLADKERSEQKVLETYLPEELPDDKVRAVIQEAIGETGAQSIKDMGQVMRVALGNLQGRADNKKVSQMVRDILSQQ